VLFQLAPAHFLKRQISRSLQFCLTLLLRLLLLTLALQFESRLLRPSFVLRLFFGFFRPPLQFLFFGFAFQFLFESNRRLTRFFLFFGSLRRLLR
jgi:hypothetical protein